MIANAAINATRRKYTNVFGVIVFLFPFNVPSENREQAHQRPRILSQRFYAKAPTETRQNSVKFAGILPYGCRDGPGCDGASLVQTKKNRGAPKCAAEVG